MQGSFQWYSMPVPWEEGSSVNGTRPLGPASLELGLQVWLFAFFITAPNMGRLIGHEEAWVVSTYRQHF